jgi:hypothetical protein
MNSDEILVKELTKLGGVSGAIGGALGGGLIGGSVTEGIVGSIAGGIGAASGSYFAAKYLPTERYGEEILIERSPLKVGEIVLKVISEIGKIKVDNEFESNNPTFFAVLGSGAFGLNPCFVSFEIVECTDCRVKLAVIGAAKEGLINQKTSKKAVQKALNLIRTKI